MDLLIYDRLALVKRQMTPIYCYIMDVASPNYWPSDVAVLGKPWFSIRVAVAVSFTRQTEESHRPLYGTRSKAIELTPHKIDAAKPVE